jgi:hypothetical protein
MIAGNAVDAFCSRRRTERWSTNTWHESCCVSSMYRHCRSGADNPSRRHAGAAAAAESGKILPLDRDDRLTRLTEHVVYYRGIYPQGRPHAILEF